MKGEYDATVVGARVVGTATARELSRFDLRMKVDKCMLQFDHQYCYNLSAIIATI